MKRTSDFDLHRFEKFISEDPASPLFARYANELINNKLFDKAIEICYKGINTHRFYISGYIILAKALISVNRIAEAKMVLEQALKLSPLCPALKKINEFLTNYSPLDKVKTEENKIADKSTEVISQINKKKESDKTDNSLEEILSKFQSAESLLIRANPDYQPKEVPKEANEEIITETMANIYINQGFYDKAIEIFKKLSQKSPAKSVYYEGRILSISQKLKSS